MAITLDGSVGITLPASGDIFNASLIRSDTTSPPTIQNTNGTEIGTFCRAWVACNGSSTILAAFNVSTVTDTGVGSITVNLTNAMPDANYAATATNQYRGAGAFETLIITARSTTSVSFAVADIVSGAAVDVPYIGASVFR
jgi:hypothetical protein